MADVESERDHKDGDEGRPGHSTFTARETTWSTTTGPDGSVGGTAGMNGKQHATGLIPKGHIVWYHVVYHHGGGTCQESYSLGGRVFDGAGIRAMAANRQERDRCRGGARDVRAT